jgi:hypothetical protein
MKSDTYTLTFLTPCFCAGADQSRADIRPSAIRGQLRWWFRALGGSKPAEREIFGGVGGEPTASSVMIRISDVVKPSSAWTPPRVDPNAPSSYVWYFARVSGKAPGSGSGTPGPRWNKDAVFSPDTSFKLHVIRRREFTSPLFEKALSCFLTLGSFGLRATRGLGAFTCAEVPFNRHILDDTGFQFTVRDLNQSSWDSEIGSLVKDTRRTLDMKSTHPSPLGSSQPRQTSGVWFRPLSNRRLAVFQPPAARTLSPQSRNGAPIHF